MVEWREKQRKTNGRPLETNPQRARANSEVVGGISSFSSSFVVGVFGKDESLRGIPRLSRLPQHSHMGYACDCPLQTKLLNKRAQARRHQHPAGNPMKNHVLAFIFT